MNWMKVTCINFNDGLCDGGVKTSVSKQKGKNLNLL